MNGYAVAEYQRKIRANGVRLTRARNAVAQAEIKRLDRKMAASRAEAELKEAIAEWKASPDAGKNENERTVYAQTQTVHEQQGQRIADNNLQVAENELIAAKLELALALDERDLLNRLIDLSMAVDESEVEDDEDEDLDEDGYSRSRLDAFSELHIRVDD